MSSETKLAACPFCGGQAFVDNERGCWMIFCADSRCCEVCTRIVPTREEAVRLWNTRTPTRDGEAERLREALAKIVQWADAYPLRVFPEPDFDVCARALKEAGQTLDAVSASNMRNVIEGVRSIARAALATRSGDG